MQNAIVLCVWLALHVTCHVTFMYYHVTCHVTFMYHHVTCHVTSMYQCVINTSSYSESSSFNYSLLALESGYYARIFVLLSTTGHVALFPLLFKPAGKLTLYYQSGIFFLLQNWRFVATRKKNKLFQCCLGNSIPCEFSALKICGIGDKKFIAHTLKIVFNR